MFSRDKMPAQVEEVVNNGTNIRNRWACPGDLNRRIPIQKGIDAVPGELPIFGRIQLAYREQFDFADRSKTEVNGIGA